MPETCRLLAPLAGKRRASVQGHTPPLGNQPQGRLATSGRVGGAPHILAWRSRALLGVRCLCACARIFRMAVGARARRPPFVPATSVRHHGRSLLFRNAGRPMQSRSSWVACCIMRPESGLPWGGLAAQSRRRALGVQPGCNRGMPCRTPLVGGPLCRMSRVASLARYRSSARQCLSHTWVVRARSICVCGCLAIGVAASRNGSCEGRVVSQRALATSVAGSRRPTQFARRPSESFQW